MATDTEGNQFLILDYITYYWKLSNVVPNTQMFLLDAKGQQHCDPMTEGWMFCVQWRDGAMPWEPMKALKETNTAEVAEYDMVMGVADEPAFTWWVPFTIKKRDHIALAVNKR